MAKFGWLSMAALILSPPALAATADHAGDSASPQAVVNAAYALISGPNGTVDRARFAHVFTSTVRFVRVASGGANVTLIDGKGFAPAFDAAVGGKPFYETGHTVHADIGLNIATIISDYESRASVTGEPFERGRNTFELVRGAAGWQVDSVFWEVRDR